MSNAADDRKLGELLVSTGRLSSEQLLASLEVQRQLGGSTHKRLGEILVERGLVTFNEIQTVLHHQGKQILWCPACQVQINVQGVVAGARYACRQCGGELQSVPPPASPAARETWAAMPVPASGVENQSDEVRQAMADPSRRIGHYVVLSELGRGGMGAVYRCLDPQLNRTVAIKILLDDLLSKPDQDTSQDLVRFRREAQAAAKIQHPGIVAIHEVGEHQGRPYLVMDLVEGETFEALLRRESPSVHGIVEIIREVSLALDHAHDVGIIHRDIKPQNVMLDAEGHPHLMDFGLARDSSAQQQLTKTGQIMGTPVYMAPEQVEGGDMGSWTDVYALGVMLFRALVGRPPFTAANPTVLFKQIIMDEPPPPSRLNPAISRDLETITLKCLEKNPDRRYPSAAAVAEELQRVLHGQATLARPIGRTERAVRWVGRNRAMAAAMAVVVLVVVSAAVVVLGQAREASRNQAELRHAAERKAARVRQESEREAVRREERARLQAELAAKEREKGVSEEAARQQRELLAADALAALREEVMAVLDRVRTGEALADPNLRRVERARLLKHGGAETVRLLINELDALTDQLAQSHGLDSDEELFLHFLCDTLADVGLQEGAVAALGRYLEVELTLPWETRDQLRAVPAGRALCLLGGEDADRLLLEARVYFSATGAFWSQVSGLYRYTGAKLDLESETVEGYAWRAFSRSLRGDHEGAIADFSRAIELDPGAAVLWSSRGIARFSNGDLEEAIADSSHAIELRPRMSEAWCNRGRARHAMGDVDGALADLNWAIELDSSYVNALLARGVVRQAANDLEGAFADCTRAVEVDPFNSQAWNIRAVAGKAMGDLAGAIDNYSRALELDPTFVDAWRNRGIARAQYGDHVGAISDFTKAIDLAPTAISSWLNRGNTRQLIGDLAGASLDYSRAIELDPTRAKAWTNRGLLRRQGGDLAGALSDLNRSLELDPDLAETWSGRGVVLRVMGELDGAIAAHARAIELDPGLPRAWFNRGVVRGMKEDYQGALQDMDRALELDSNFLEAWLNRGSARASLGDDAGAIADWQHFLELAPDRSVASAVRVAIEKARQRLTAGDDDGR